MRREKKRAEKVERFYAQEARLREKRQRKNSNPSRGSSHELRDGTVAAGAFEPQPTATFLSASEK